MDFTQLCNSRRSIRSFTNRDVSKDDVLKLLKAAQAAPSAGNRQPWHFFVIRDEVVRSAITGAAGPQPFMLSAPVMLVVCADAARSESRYGERGRNLYCLQDTAAAVQNILLCAKNLGLGACWCGAFNEDAVSRILNLPAKLRPIAVIPVGHPASEPLVAPTRRPLDEIVTYIGESTVDGEYSDEAGSRKIEHCDMASAEFNDVNLGGSVFTNVNLRETEISDVNLSGGRIHECDLSNLAIYNCKLDGMTIDGKSICFKERQA
jgi:nitroreductase